MMTVEIPQIEWSEFFNKLSRERHEWQTSIEVVRDELGSRFIARDLPLEGVTFEPKQHEQGAIEIMIGGKTENHQTHSIVNPVRISFLQNDILPGCLIAIKSADKAKTLIHIFRPIPVLANFSNFRLTSISP